MVGICLALLWFRVDYRAPQKCDPPSDIYVDKIKNYETYPIHIFE